MLRGWVKVELWKRYLNGNCRKKCCITGRSRKRWRDGVEEGLKKLEYETGDEWPRKVHNAGGFLKRLKPTRGCDCQFKKISKTKETKEHSDFTCFPSGAGKLKIT